MRRFAHCAALFTAVATALAGNCFGFGENQALRSLLFRGRPLPVCKSFFIYEIGYLGRLNSPDGLNSNMYEKQTLVMDAGFMVNLSPTQALGGIGHLSADNGAVRTAALLRYRRWLWATPAGGRPLRLDIDAGPVIATLDEGYINQKSLNLSAGAALNVEDLFAVTLRYETFRTPAMQYQNYFYPPYDGQIKFMPARTNGTFFLGVKGGSFLAAGTSVVLGGAFLVFLSIYPND